MKWQSIAAGALASVFFAFGASAEVRITNDPGGEVSSYVQKFQQIRASGERVVIDGPCLSACTLLTGIVPRDRVCITQRAMLGFHAASYYDDVTRSLVPTRQQAGDELLPAANPAVDQSSRRADAPPDRVARPRTVGALPDLPVRPFG